MTFWETALKDMEIDAFNINNVKIGRFFILC